MAEVLITLGIIGVVSAMTIPTLVAKYQKHITETRLKETYSILTNMVRLSIAENGEFDPYGDLVTKDFSRQNSKVIFEKYFAPFVKVNFKYSDSDCTKLTEHYSQAKNSEKYIDYNGTCYNLLNGTGISLWAGQQTSVYPLFSVAVVTNPNKKIKIAGKDIFKYYISFEDGIQILTYPRVHNLKLNDSQLITYCGSSSARINYGGYHMSRAEYCTELVMRNGFKIPKNYPVKF